MPILKHCRFHGCQVLVPAGSGGCPEHKGTEIRQARDQHSGRKTAEWRRLRKARLELDNYQCQLRLAGCTEVATSVHLDPERRGEHRGARLRDVLSACAHCHGVVDGQRAGRYPGTF